MLVAPVLTHLRPEQPAAAAKSKAKIDDDDEEEEAAARVKRGAARRKVDEDTDEVGRSPFICLSPSTALLRPYPGSRRSDLDLGQGLLRFHPATPYRHLWASPLQSSGYLRDVDSMATAGLYPSRGDALTHISAWSSRRRKMRRRRRRRGSRTRVPRRRSTRSSTRKEARPRARGSAQQQPGGPPRSAGRKRRRRRRGSGTAESSWQPSTSRTTLRPGSTGRRGSRCVEGQRSAGFQPPVPRHTYIHWSLQLVHALPCPACPLPCLSSALPCLALPCPACPLPFPMPTGCPALPCVSGALPVPGRVF